MVIEKWIIEAIEKERDRQNLLFGGEHSWGKGDCSSPDTEEIVKSAVLSEECGEVSRAVLDHNRRALKKELIQVAAVAIAWLTIYKEV